MKISLVIPALNAEETVGNIIQIMKSSPLIDEIIVIDNDSIDNTFAIAKEHGADVIRCKQRGLGFAMKKGILNAHNNLVMKIDSDIINPKIEWVSILSSTLRPNLIFANGIYSSDYDEFPMNLLVAKPALKIRYPNLEYIKLPLSGIYIFRKNLIDISILPNDWAFDLSMLLEGHFLGGEIGQIDIGPLNDKEKKIKEYSEMAFEIMRFIFSNNHI